MFLKDFSMIFILFDRVKKVAHSKILGIIPARYGSTRFPGKMLANILGKSLIRRTYENAKRSTRLDDLIVATDDERIFRHVEDFGGKVFMTSLDCPSGSDRAAEVVKSFFPESEMIVNIQGDEPCLDPQIIDALIEDLEANPQAVMTTPVVPISNPVDAMRSSVVKCVFTPQKKALYFSRSPIPFPLKQELTVPYFRHLGVYCFRREFLLRYGALPKTPLQGIEDLEQLKILEHGFSIYVSVVQDESFGVDTVEDVKRIEEILLCKENISSSPEEWSPPLVKA